MKLHSLFLITAIASCKGNSSQPPAPEHITVTSYKKVGEGYSYSGDLLKYNGTVYLPLVTGMYFRDSLSGAAVYKPEGKLGYSKKELDEDTLFKSTLELPDVRRIRLTEKEVTDGEVRYGITERKNDSVFCVRADTLLLYYFH
ncbi:hypothetical protein A4H97_30015 [Niastella yeongjuensis]|uniref:Uncharacterized protein n=1 Tax=Niastella yeongjuensis TaxID=354355 RepID=A0A1V9EPQ8_9BACT|nr:hypothetical protein [Niastella yeongjuensis]OQP48071.1 hypothetical protein A4H97_30015 [Niastella yeongjuensis]SEO25625.1 hypothetical protein SAMN05660816_02404 [Niastella yeongjuensis]